jgi:hypothetical protein
MERRGDKVVRSLKVSIVEEVENGGGGIKTRRD